MYYATIPDETKGVAFRAVPQIESASVYVACKFVTHGNKINAIVTDADDAFREASKIPRDTWRSQWFLVHKGVEQKFNIYVKHPDAVVPKEYLIEIRRSSEYNRFVYDSSYFSRPSVWYASYRWVQRLANVVAFSSFIVSSVEGAGFITNTKFLHVCRVGMVSMLFLFLLSFFP